MIREYSQRIRKKFYSDRFFDVTGISFLWYKICAKSEEERPLVNHFK